MPERLYQPKRGDLVVLTAGRVDGFAYVEQVDYADDGVTPILFHCSSTTAPTARGKGTDMAAQIRPNEILSVIRGMPWDGDELTESE